MKKLLYLFFNYSLVIVGLFLYSLDQLHVFDPIFKYNLVVKGFTKAFRNSILDFLGNLPPVLFGVAKPEVEGMAVCGEIALLIAILFLPFLLWLCFFGKQKIIKTTHIVGVNFYAGAWIQIIHFTKIPLTGDFERFMVQALFVFLCNFTYFLIINGVTSTPKLRRFLVTWVIFGGIYVLGGATPYFDLLYLNKSAFGGERNLVFVVIFIFSLTSLLLSMTVFRENFQGISSEFFIPIWGGILVGLLFTQQILEGYTKILEGYSEYVWALLRHFYKWGREVVKVPKEPNPTWNPLVRKLQKLEEHEVFEGPVKILSEFKPVQWWMIVKTLLGGFFTVFFLGFFILILGYYLIIREKSPLRRFCWYLLQKFGGVKALNPQNKSRMFECFTSLLVVSVLSIVNILLIGEGFLVIYLGLLVLLVGFWWIKLK